MDSSVYLSCPRSWAALSQEQLRYVFWLLATFADRTVVKTYMLVRFTGIGVLGRTRFGYKCTWLPPGQRRSRVFYMQTWQMHSMLSQLSWVDSIETMDNRLDVVQGLAAVHPLLHRDAATGRTVTFNDYLCMERHYQHFLDTHSEESIDLLASFLYRRPDFSRPDTLTLTPAERLATIAWYAHIKAVMRAPSSTCSAARATAATCRTLRCCSVPTYSCAPSRGRRDQGAAGAGHRLLARADRTRRKGAGGRGAGSRHRPPMTRKTHKNDIRMKTLFPALDYFRGLVAHNRLAAVCGFKACLCSDPDSIQGVMEQFRRVSHFVMVDDTTSQNTFSNGVGYFRRDVYTVFIVAAYRYDDMDDRQQKLDLCRTLFRQMHSRMLHDRDELGDDRLAYLRLENIYSTELPRYAMNGVTGLYFTVQNEQPIDISYDKTKWT